MGGGTRGTPGEHVRSVGSGAGSHRAHPEGATVPVLVHLERHLASGRAHDRRPERDRSLLLETRIAAPVKRGVHRVRLADHGVRLAPGVAYQWSVAVIPDTGPALARHPGERQHRARRAHGELGPKLAAAGSEDLASRYAEAGIWYDALEAVCDLIERSPDDARLAALSGGTADAGRAAGDRRVEPTTRLEDSEQELEIEPVALNGAGRRLDLSERIAPIELELRSSAARGRVRSVPSAVRSRCPRDQVDLRSAGQCSTPARSRRTAPARDSRPTACCRTIGMRASIEARKALSRTSVFCG